MSSSSGSDSGGGGRTDSQSQYGGGSYDSSQNQSGRGQSFGGGNDNREQRITNQYTSPEGIAVASRDPAFGDPDPQVDIPPQERDSITSFLDNYSANIKANPFMGSTIGALTTLYQTERAKNMLMDTPGYEFLGNYNVSDDGVVSGDGGSKQLTNMLVSQLPLSMTGAAPQESMVNEYFANLGMGQQPLSSSLQTSYNNAKNNVSSILGTNQQFGYSTAPYGLLSSTNLADNPFNIEYLQQRGLI
tara:strand:+ start:44 stop:778 length:735 start_codon:yes stop_codon:yes gene_type:complete